MTIIRNVFLKLLKIPNNFFITDYKLVQILFSYSDDISSIH